MSNSKRRAVANQGHGAGRGRETRGQLSRQRIFDAALTISDRDGASAVTMRRVARELGVEAMSLYYHVRDREDLLDGLAETMVRSGLPPPQPGADASAILSAFARGIRATGLSHPDAFYLVGLRPLRNAEATAAIAALLNALAETEMRPDQAVLAYRTTAAFARGFVLSEIAGLTYGPHADTPLPDTLDPYATALGRDSEDVFEAGLKAIVDGLMKAED